MPPPATAGGESKWRQAGSAPGVRLSPVRSGWGSATESRAGRPIEDGKAWECLGWRGQREQSSVPGGVGGCSGSFFQLRSAL